MAEQRSKSYSNSGLLEFFLKRKQNKQQQKKPHYAPTPGQESSGDSEKGLSPFLAYSSTMNPLRQPSDDIAVTACT